MDFLETSFPVFRLYNSNVYSSEVPSVNFSSNERSDFETPETCLQVKSVGHSGAGSIHKIGRIKTEYNLFIYRFLRFRGKL